MKEIHVYNNGLRCYKEYIFPGALERYGKYINLHEPFEETIFNEILLNQRIHVYLNVGAAWGYYSLLAKKINPNIEIHAFEPDTNLAEAIRENMLLNKIRNVHIHDKFVSGINDAKNITLNKFISDLNKEIGLISMDIQGSAAKAFLNANEQFGKIRNILLGTHGKEHKRCLKIFKKYGFKIRYEGKKIPMQPDGIIWAEQR